VSACHLASDDIRVVAASPDGWAFCRQAGRLILVRPPFGARFRFPQTEVQMERAIRHEDFRPCLEECAGWPEVERHLREVIVGTATPEALAMAKDAARRILARGAAASTPLAVAEKDAVGQVERDRRTHAGGPRLLDG
jgi:hypothetical protein